jgi:serine/threonine-protein kinase
MVAHLEVEGKAKTFRIDPANKDVMVGRRDPASRRFPDVDLEDFEGYRKGVSRRHAAFRFLNSHLEIQDYGSANGTFVNGIRLPAHRTHGLRDGDVIRFGHLTTRIYFVENAKTND